ncbi:UDP-glycosyltransferase 43-like [Cornus florida]|uniref:UDP-glycosyltransferase 43-like n=1 Tax=Cornus florida TaxID=4283 RepID=UPI00289BFC78|nr:UDP-glycosyltransferase 43-like [Cornus florida]
MKKAQIIIIPTPGIGNLVPAVEFAQHLTNTDQRFIATIFIISFPQRPLVGAYVDSRATTATGSVRFVHLPPLDPPSPDQYKAPLGFISLMIEKHRPHVKHAINNLVSTESESDSVPLAGLFVDMFCTSMIDVAGELGVPCYLYFPSPATFLGFMLHLPTLQTRVTTDFDDSDTEFTIPGFANSVPSRVFPPAMLKIKEDGYYWFLHHGGRYRETKGIIVNTFRELEPYALDTFLDGDVPPVYPIGPVIDHHGPGRWHSDLAHHDDIMKWLDPHPPSSVVFLCFGSMGSLSGAQVREIATGLERTGYRFVWAIRQLPKGTLDLPTDYMDLKEIMPDGFLERTAGIGLVCGWVPQVSILAHKAIGGFVSHCGWNSILESLWYGVPIATWPVYAEQQMNAFEMMKELGLAVEISLDYRAGSDLVLAEEVERGVRRLMDGDGEVRIKWKEMSEKSRKAVMENGSSFTARRNLIGELMAAI